MIKAERSVTPLSMLREFASYPALFGKLLRYRKALTPERIAYGDDPAQYLLHFSPETPARDTLVVYLHGGGWNSGSPSMFHFIGQRFAQAGYRCLMPGYRLAPRHRFPAQIEDVCAGYAAGLAHLASLGVPVRRVVVVGSSAGAHLGALLCYDAAMQARFSIDPACIGGFIGLGSPCFFGGKGNAYLNLMLCGLFGSRDFSPGEPYAMLRAGQSIPMLLIHGHGDGVVPYGNAEAFCNRAASLGIPAQLYTVPPPMDTHSVYSAGIFLNNREDDPTLDALMAWIGNL